MKLCSSIFQILTCKRLKCRTGEPSLAIFNLSSVFSALTWNILMVTYFAVQLLIIDLDRLVVVRGLLWVNNAPIHVGTCTVACLICKKQSQTSSSTYLIPVWSTPPVPMTSVTVDLRKAHIQNWSVTSKFLAKTASFQASRDSVCVCVFAGVTIIWNSSWISSDRKLAKLRATTTFIAATYRRWSDSTTRRIAALYSSSTATTFNRITPAFVAALSS